MNNTKIIIGLFGIFTLMVLSCAKDSVEKTTEHGYPIEMHKDEAGPVAKEGEILFFKMKVSAKDSVLFSTFEQSKAQEYKWPAEDQRSKMNDPVIDAFAMMSAGDSVLVRMPKDSLKGPDFGLKSGEFLDYHLKLDNIMSADEYQQFASEREQKMQAERALIQSKESEIAELVKTTLQAFKANNLGSELQSTASGLEYIVHQEGSGAIPAVNEKINVHYYGVLESDGSMFDNSFQRGTPFSLNLGKGMVIPGWDEGLALLNKGSKATLFIPYTLAYGAAGRPPSIPEKSDLVFYVELMEE